MKNNQTSIPGSVLLILFFVFNTVNSSCQKNQMINQDNNTTTVNYLADSTHMANPERGWYHYFMAPCCDNPPNTINGPHYPLSLSDLLSYRNGTEKITVIKDAWKIQNWTSDIPQSYLNQLSKDLATIRQAGMKVQVRILYNWSIIPGDAPAKWILRHMDQLTPIIQNNLDVIMCMEAGVFGTCSEGCCGSVYLGKANNGWTSLADSAKLVYAKILDAIGEDRMFALRYPRLKFDMMDWENGNNFPANAIPLAESNAFEGTMQARIGFADQNFGGDINHYGMFNSWEEPERNFMAGDSKYVIVTGEPSANTPYNRINGYTDLKKYHFTIFNSGGDGWSEIKSSWQSSGQYDKIDRSLGYRFSLVSATIPATISLGSTFNMSMDMVNNGFAGIMNPRKVEIIFRNTSTGAKYVIDIDIGKGNRLWLPGPGETKTLEITGGIPDIIPGKYEVILNLPDPYPSIHDRPEYSIRLANQNVWEESTGYNLLGHTVKVEKESDAVKYSGDNFFK